MDLLLKAVAVFAGMVVLDYVWALYISACSDGKRMPAAYLSSALIAISGLVTVGYVQEPWLLVPAALGAFVGTWFAVDDA